MLKPKCFQKFRKFSQILILTLDLWPYLVNLVPSRSWGRGYLTCFRAKIAQILQKVIVLFPERWEEIEPWFWHIWITQWLRFFPITTYLFRFRPSSGGNGSSNLDQKCKVWVRLFFIKAWILQVFFKECFCLLD